MLFLQRFGLHFGFILAPFWLPFGPLLAPFWLPFRALSPPGTPKAPPSTKRNPQSPLCAQNCAKIAPKLSQNDVKMVTNC